MTAPEPFTLTGTQFKADPYPTYAAMRSATPLYCRTSADGLARLWFITRYEDVAAALRDHQRFVKNVESTLTREEREAQPHAPELFDLLTHHMLNADGATHARLRSLVNKAFSAGMVEQLTPRIQHIADHLVDSIATRGHMDVVEEFALPLAIEVIADLLGIDASNHQRVRAWSRMLVSPSASNERNTQKTIRLRQVMEDFVAFLTHLCAERRRRPRPDLISALLTAEEAGDQLSQDELFSMVLLILIVGHETSVHLISNCVLNLAERPELAATLRDCPEQIPAAVEELIRFDGPVERATMRFVADDMCWQGATLRRGDGVSLILASAHRDPGCCPEPDDLDITRTSVRHLGFGLGPHYCLGAPLARIEAQIAINTLLQKLPPISLAVPRAQLRWHSNPILHGVKQLPICWPDR